MATARKRPAAAQRRPVSERDTPENPPARRVAFCVNSVPAMNVSIVSVSPRTSDKGTHFFVGLLEGHGLIKGFSKVPVTLGEVVTASVSDTKSGFAAFVGY